MQCDAVNQFQLIEWCVMTEIQELSRKQANQLVKHLPHII